MKNLTETKALMILSGSNTEVKDNKMIVNEGGFKGLSQCSALDYLVNHCGYRAIIKEGNK